MFAITRDVNLCIPEAVLFRGNERKLRRLNDVLLFYYTADVPAFLLKLQKFTESIERRKLYEIFNVLYDIRRNTR